MVDLDVNAPIFLPRVAADLRNRIQQAAGTEDFIPAPVLENPVPNEEPAAEPEAEFQEPPEP